MRTSLLSLGAQIMAALDQAPSLVGGVIPRDKLDPVYQSSYTGFQEPEIFVFSQIAGSTACGWGGMGGAAMTQYFALAITFPRYNAAAVYITGRCAYVCEMDEAFDAFIKNKILPTWSEVDQKGLNLYWKHNTNKLQSRKEDSNG